MWVYVACAVLICLIWPVIFIPQVALYQKRENDYTEFMWWVRMGAVFAPFGVFILLGYLLGVFVGSAMSAWEAVWGYYEQRAEKLLEKERERDKNKCTPQ